MTPLRDCIGCMAASLAGCTGALMLRPTMKPPKPTPAAAAATVATPAALVPPRCRCRRRLGAQLRGPCWHRSAVLTCHSAAAGEPAGPLGSMEAAVEEAELARLAGIEGITAAAAASAAAAEAEEAVAADAAAAAGATAGEPAGKWRGMLQSREIGEMLGFALPALGMVLADPLMSLIDTACVGRVSSVQLAALGPNTAIFNFAFQLFAFLGVGTTNIIATNSLETAGLDSSTLHVRREAAERTLCNSLQLALACGCLVVAVLLAAGRPLLAGMGTAPELMHPAWQYLSIRALAAPAVLIMSVSQGACLGQQDAWTDRKSVV